MSHDGALREKLMDVINEHFEKIHFQAKRRGKNKRYIPQRPSIEIDTADLTYAYA
jgi:hypothetical protein